MSTHHPELAAEQAHLDRAYSCLEAARADAVRLRGHVESTRGGTFQARYERDVIEDTVRSRLSDLSLGDHALIFGRIDRVDEGVLEAFHIGRLAVADEEHEPVVVDWRAPVAEPFYRATGRQPMGLARRRHFSVKGRTIVDMEDELFGEGRLGIVGDGGVLMAARPDGLRGYGTLMAALERSRTGQLGDIVATIQSEQDEIIRSPVGGVLVVQGGPGTGKTVVALHRAAYLLYTHRFPLEDQGVLVVGPNRIFLRYIERVLPSLGEAGVEQVVLGDLAPDVTIRAHEVIEVARVKGEAQMAKVIAKAVRDRQRPLREGLRVPYGLGSLRMGVHESARIVQAAGRRFRRHNAARKFVEGEVIAALAASSRNEDDTVELVRERVRHSAEVRVALERMWPVLTPAELLHDLFGSKALLHLAGRSVLDDEDLILLYRGRSEHLDDVAWTDADVALLDEARAVLGPRPVKGRIRDADETRTYGHIVVDEAQDLTPMQLRMVTRRSLNGSMTIVGDIAQATGPFAPDRWSDILRHLPDRRPSRLVELTVGYRIPGTVMEMANRVLRVAVPGMEPPKAVRLGDRPPTLVQAQPDGLGEAVVAAVRGEQAVLGDGSLAVVVPDSLIGPIALALEEAGVAFEKAALRGLDAPVSLVGVRLVKGLEVDGVVVVEPQRIVDEEPQGLRSLYVALTRSTQTLAVVHTGALPDILRAP